MQKIDPHLHVYSLDKGRYPRLKVKTQPPPEPAQAEDYLKLARHSDIQKAVLVVPSYYGTDASYALDTAEKHPERFRVVVIGDPTGKETRHLMRSQLEDPRVAGVRFNLLGDRRDGARLGADSDLLKAVDLLARTPKAAVIHVREEQLDAAAVLAQRHPHTPFVIDHMGYPSPGDRVNDSYRQVMERLAALQNIYIKISGFEMKSATGYPFNDMLVYARYVLATLGIERCMWASNYPYILNAATLPQSVSVGEALLEGQSDAEKERFFNGTAAALFWRES